MVVLVCLLKFNVFVFGCVGEKWNEWIGGDIWVKVYLEYFFIVIKVLEFSDNILWDDFFYVIYVKFGFYWVGDEGFDLDNFFVFGGFGYGNVWFVY